MAALRLATRGERWPSGELQVIAKLAVDDAWVESLVDAPLFRDLEDGLGEWVGTGGQLESGEPVELVRYELSPKRLFELRADALADANEVLTEFMATTNLDADAVSWRL